MSVSEPKYAPLKGTTNNSLAQWVAIKTPVIIIGSYFLAVAIAVGNFVFFQLLDGRLVEPSIPQTYVSNIANALVRVFSISLTVASSTAFTQLLWRYMRQKSLKVSTIDGLMSVPTSALELSSLDMLRSTTTLWFFGVVLQLIPLATIFPPGALVVAPKLTSSVENVSVPVFDVNFRGDNSFNGMYNNALFMLGGDGWYRYPSDSMFSTAKSALLSGEYLTRNSPCGLNCSYAIELEGPDFSCHQETWDGLKERVFQYYGNFSSYQNKEESRGQEGWSDFLAGPTERDGKFSFDVQSAAGHFPNISCTYFAAQYRVNVSYLDGIEDVKVDVKQQYPLNSTVLSNPYLFIAWNLVDDINDTVRFNQPIPDDQVLWNSTSNADPVPLSTAYREQNIRSIADALAISLGGAIEAKGNGAGNGFVGEFIGNTLITQTPWVHTNVSYYGATFDFSELTASLFEQMLRNVTMSMLARPNTNVHANVTKTPWRNAYAFARKDSLIAAYAVSLIVSALFIVLGIFALFNNGVAAETGGFMQILCTTTGDFLDINKEASKCSIGGAISFSERLKDMRVRFGGISGIAESDGAPRAGFGTEKEMVPTKNRG